MDATPFHTVNSWRPPRSDRVPNTRVLYGLLEYGPDSEKLVPVARIFGMDVGAEAWNPDWTLNIETFLDDPGLLRYHLEKLDGLMNGVPERGRLPIRESDLVEGLGRKYLTLHLIEIDGVYFVGSGGVHRVAVAHQLGFKSIKAVVTIAKFRADAPKAAVDWVGSFRAER